VTDVQILTIAIALGTSFLAVLVGVLLNNSRLNDVKELLTAKLSAGNADLRLVIERNHSELMLKLADIEGRLTKIENERRIVQ
jgi:hypothetical protein